VQGRPKGRPILFGGVVVMEKSRKKAIKKPKNKPKTPPKKRGRESKYFQLEIPKRLKEIEGWRRQGSSEEEVAEMLSVAPSTVSAWKGAHPEFKEALRTGARAANGEILNSAFKQAVGYHETHEEVVKLRKVVYTSRKNEDGELEPLRDAKGTVVLEDVEKIVDVKKYYPPDARMTMFMMVNRLPGDYKMPSKDQAPSDDENETGVVMLPEVIESAGEQLNDEAS
jgi:hypothetical protein